MGDTHALPWESSCYSPVGHISLAKTTQRPVDMLHLGTVSRGGFWFPQLPKERVEANSQLICDLLVSM